MENTAKEVRFGGWGTATSELAKPYMEQIQTSYRTIEAACKKDADDYMQMHYEGVVTTCGHVDYKISVNKSHGKQKVRNSSRYEFFYIIHRKKLTSHWAGQVGGIR